MTPLITVFYREILIKSFDTGTGCTCRDDVAYFCQFSNRDIQYLCTRICQTNRERINAQLKRSIHSSGGLTMILSNWREIMSRFRQ